MRKISKLLAIILISVTSLVLFTGCGGINKSEIEIIEDSENITQTVIFRGVEAPYYGTVFRAKYQKKEQLFHSGWLEEEKLWNRAKILDEDASNIILLDKKIKDDVYIEKYKDGNVVENLLCFSNNGLYYGFKVNFHSLVPQYLGDFEIEPDDLTDLYIDRQENMDIVNPDYEVLNYGTFKLVWSSLVDYDYFYFVSSRTVYIYDGETTELFKTIEVEEDIYGVGYGEASGETKGEKLLIAVKDGKQFKVMEYDIQSRDNA